MSSRKRPREKNLTQQYLEGDFDEEKIERLDGKEKKRQEQKMAATAVTRVAAEAGDIDLLPIGQVRQVFSLFSQVRLGTGEYQRTVQCTVRKTMAKLRDSAVVVGDYVRVRETKKLSEGVSEGVIERVEPRKTVLTRADSFKALTAHPIVANATRMMIVVAVTKPAPKWGLVDRMLAAAKSGKLEPIICLNKVDLGELDPETLVEARDVMAHYRTLGVRAEETCATREGSEAILKEMLRGQRTVLAGHSGVGKSSLVRLIAPKLDIRIGEISEVHEKGMHTTTSARTYDLPELVGDDGTATEVIDTPGVKLFGLWNMDEEALEELFPDVVAKTAPEWRVESYGRILESLGKRET